MIEKVRSIFLNHPTIFKWSLNSWPPFLGAGIRVKHISEDYRNIEVEMKLTWYNRNYVHTQFGGCLSMMTDPFYMLILVKNLGKDYIVWDKSGFIDFVAPGTGPVKACFKIDEATLLDIKTKTADGSKYLPTFELNIVGDEDKLIAKVVRTIYIRKKKRLHDRTL
ncbi:MAG: DUF4442 domain-containing protein [Gammaproteobacteria bacterium]|nr:DUF4442 domain-containing protein [Gammaproteobacteria bacterium]